MSITVSDSGDFVLFAHWASSLRGEAKVSNRNLIIKLPRRGVVLILPPLFEMSLYLALARPWFEFRRARVRRQVLAQSGPATLGRADWSRSLKDPTGFYLDTYRWFHQHLPPALADHRTYFASAGRGFGEDAFHVLWAQLVTELKPASFLEIGVFRGQVVTLVALLSRLAGQLCEVVGISPFTPAGDSVSRYATDVDYLADTLQNFDHFGLAKPRLLRAYSTDPQAVALIESRPWDLIYIDGSHDYEVVVRDWEVCSRSVRPGGVIVLDDSGLTTAFRPPCFATGGHPGPSRLASELDRSRFREVLQVGHNRAFERIA